TKIEDHIGNFYNKETNENYFLKYDQEHGARLDFTVNKFALELLENKTIADFGCGYGFLFKRLKQNNTFSGFDGADIDLSKRLSSFEFFKVDLNTPFGQDDKKGTFDVSFCFETLEHLENPYRC